MLSNSLGLRGSRLDRIAGRVQILGSWRSSPLLLWLVVALHEFVDVYVEFEKLLSNEVFDEFIVVDKFLIVNLGSALQFHLLGIVLPLDLNLNECPAD